MYIKISFTDSCTVPSHFRDIFPNCNGSLSYFTEDTKTYTLGWKLNKFNRFGGDEYWTYSTAFHSGAPMMCGKIYIFILERI